MARNSRLSRRKRIAYVITRLVRGGAQKVCLDIISALKNKYEMTLISGTETGPEGSFWPEFRSAGINIKSISEIVRGIAPMKDFRALLKLYRFFKKWNPDVVHCHTAKAGVLGCVAARLAGIERIIWSPHGHIFSANAQIPQVSGFSMHIFYWLWKSACFCSNKIIALSNADKNDQVALKLGPEHKFTVIYNGINIPTNVQAADLDGHPVIGMIGRLSTEKGQEYLIRAAGILKTRYPNIKLLVIGDGPQKPGLESLAHKLDISPNVIFTGMVSDVYPLIRRMDIAILPSLYEAFGLVLLEAMAMKKPVIATRVNGVPEIVAEGSTGLLVPPADAGALVDAVIQLIDNPDSGRAMSESGYQRLNRLFTREQMIGKVESIYA